MFILNGTLEYCIRLCEMSGKAILINDGKVIGFQQEEIPTQTANPSGDK